MKEKLALERNQEIHKNVKKEVKRSRKYSNQDCVDDQPEDVWVLVTKKNGEKCFKKTAEKVKTEKKTTVEETKVQKISNKNQEFGKTGENSKEKVKEKEVKMRSVDESKHFEEKQKNAESKEKRRTEKIQEKVGWKRRFGRNQKQVKEKKKRKKKWFLLWN